MTINIERIIKKHRLAVAAIQADERLAAQLSDLLNHHKQSANMIEGTLARLTPPPAELHKLRAVLADMRRAIGRLQDDLAALARGNAERRADLAREDAKLTVALERAALGVDTSMPADVVVGLLEMRRKWGQAIIT